MAKYNLESSKPGKRTSAYSVLGSVSSEASRNMKDSEKKRSKATVKGLRNKQKYLDSL